MTRGKKRNKSQQSARRGSTTDDDDVLMFDKAELKSIVEALFNEIFEDKFKLFMKEKLTQSLKIKKSNL